MGEGGGGGRWDWSGVEGGGEEYPIHFEFPDAVTTDCV